MTASSTIVKNILIAAIICAVKLIILALVAYSIDIKSLIGHIYLTANVAEPAVKKLVAYSIDVKSLIGHISLTANVAEPAVKNCLGNNINKTEKL